MWAFSALSHILLQSLGISEHYRSYQVYVQTLKDILLAFVEAFTCQQWVFHEDNAQLNKARITEHRFNFQ